MLENLFLSFGIVLIVSAILGIIASYLKQPLILAYIVVGVLLDTFAGGILGDTAYVSFIADVAIAVLLFTVGLKLDADELASSGKTSLVTAIVQMVATAGVGFLAAWLLGFLLVDSLFVAIAVSLSSTIVVIKVLSDRDELESLHGRIAIGILIVQDIVAILILLVITALGESATGDRSGSLIGMFISTIGLGLIFIVGVLLFGRFVLPRIMARVAKSSELLILFTMAWAISLAAIGDYIGLGMELGAFIAGLALAPSMFKDTVLSRLTPLRDFFLVFFFVNLGLNLDLGGALNLLPAALLISLLVTVMTPIVVTWTMGRLGYHRMTGFFTGLAVSQISEFSLILCTLGLAYGLISPEASSLITLVAIITIVASTYLMRFAGKIYRALSKILRPLQHESSVVREDSTKPDPLFTRPSVIVFGLGRYGTKISDELADRGISVIGVDFDPHIVKRPITNEKLQYRYGDVEDPEICSYVPVDKADIIVAALPSATLTTGLQHTLMEFGFSGTFYATGTTDYGNEELEKAGITHILSPFDDAAEAAVERIEMTLDALSYEDDYTYDDDAGTDDDGDDELSCFEMDDDYGIDDEQLRKALKSIGSSGQVS